MSGVKKIAVREIVEQVLRSGDIDNRYADPTSMYEGTKAHKKIQKTMGDNYQSEVSLSLDVEIDGEEYIIIGRADGIIIDENNNLCIDEIKTTLLPLEKLYSQHEMHLAQAKCYAYMYCLTSEYEFEKADVQLTYYQLETEELMRHPFTFTYEELRTFFYELLDKYAVWLRFDREWRIKRDDSITLLEFPFLKYRKGQRELAVAVYRTVENQKKLYAQAPTGIGKTLSAIFPTLKALSLGKCEKIFYLTAKTVTRAVAEDTVKLLISKNLKLKTLTLKAKDKICINEQVNCNPIGCSYAEGHYDRVNDAVLDIIENNDLITSEIIVEYSRKYRVCPHETALDVSLRCDLIIGDYNHVFDPTAYLHRFFGENEKRNYVFLVDEAHNLCDRVRDMYSLTLRKSDFLSIKKGLKDTKGNVKKLKKALNDINSCLLNIRKESADDRNYSSKELDKNFLLLLDDFFVCCEEWLSGVKQGGHNMFDEIMNIFFEVRLFLLISEIFDSNFSYLTEIYGSDVAITLYCLNPSEIIAEKLKKAIATVMFSATLTPLGYYREILGGDENDFIISLPSPFLQENLRLFANVGISTVYKRREESYLPTAIAIKKAISYKNGNYMCFFPSFDFLKRVYDVFSENYPDVKTAVQDSRMSEEERSDFLMKFDENNHETLVGFCVLGGIFSEGIDLKGDRLIGAVIVGVGLPKLTYRQDLIRDYFNAKNGFGFEFAYVYPGMNKILQAAGRVIRTEEDEGLVLLIDERYQTNRYKSLFPDFWNHIKFIKNVDELPEQL